MTSPKPPDAVVVGGGAAGSSAALVLGRARADGVLIDAGEPSNAPSTGVGGLLGHDGIAPADLYRRAAEEIAAYPSVLRRTASVTAIRPGEDTRWRVELDDGDVLPTERLLLATGMRYDRPDIDGLEPFWGASVFHCPFCHGWEHRDQPLVALGGDAMAAERPLLLRRWSDDVTLVTHGSAVDPEERRRLERAGVRIVEAHATALRGDGRHLASVELDDGSAVVATGMLVPAPHVLRRPELLDGLDLEVGPTGHLVVDGFAATSVPGIWAAGDLTSPMASVARAIAEGSLAAAGITRDLVMSSDLADA